jgi:protein-S-isoprenylcysteine O-methyltransferase Ste14
VTTQHAAARAFAWAGAVLFAAALGYFLFSYSLTFGEITEGTIAPGAIAFDIALFSVFALHHSIFARIPVRSFVRQIVTEKLERSVYVWVASLMLIGVCYAWRAVPGVLWQVSRPWNWAIVAVQLVAIWLTLRSAAVIDGLDLAGVRQFIKPKAQIPNPNAQSPNPKSQNDAAQTMEFKTDGPYGWVRHPIYLGWILVVFCVGTMTMTRFVFAAISSLYLLIAIPFEERTIRRQSPGYDDYMRRVPWKLIPRVY